ncbi:MAG: hypothetical protein D4R41_04090, partial [Sediminibacterium sp.]
LDVADVILPIASSYENVGTYVNMSGVWQSFDSVVMSDYEVKFGWKSLLDLASVLKLNGFNYIDSYHVLSEMKSFINETCTLSWNFNIINNLTTNIKGDLIVIPYWSQYNVDSLVRRATSLQKNLKNNDLESNFILKCNDVTYDKFIFNKEDVIDKNFIINIDNSISDGVIFIRKDNLLNYLNYYSLYEVFSFDKN